MISKLLLGGKLCAHRSTGHLSFFFTNIDFSIAFICLCVFIEMQNDHNVIFSNEWPFSKRFWASFELLLLPLNERRCSLYLFSKILPVCPITIFIHCRKYRLHFIINYQFYACNVKDEI